jgi:hypothetical protein
MKTKIRHCPLVGYVLGKNEVISTENVAPLSPTSGIFARLISWQFYDSAILSPRYPHQIEKEGEFARTNSVVK